MPLNRGRFPVSNPLDIMLARNSNATKGNLAIRSNLYWLSFAAASDQAAALTTKKLTTVPIPVAIGDLISKVSYRTGATAAAELEDSFVALYSGAPATGEPVLLGQSKNNASLTAGATTTVEVELEKPVGITTANAPYGYIYASVCITAKGKVPSLATIPAPATALSADTTHGWLTNMPCFCQKHGSVTTTAPAKVESGELYVNAPVLLLS